MALIVTANFYTKARAFAKDVVVPLYDLSVVSVTNSLEKTKEETAQTLMHLQMGPDRGGTQIEQTPQKT